MSILKKIFGKKSEAEELQRNRAMRVPISPLHRISFALASGKEVSLSNVSIGGMAVVYRSEFNWKLGDTVTGELNVNGRAFPLQVQIRHLAGKSAGCQFLTESLEVRKAIENYLRGEILAMRLRKIDDGYVKPDPRGTVLWFSDHKQNEVYCVLDQKGLIAFHMSFLGNYLEGDLVRGTRAGYVKEADRHDSPGIKGASLLTMAGSTPEETLRLARTIVQHVAQLPENTKAELIRLLNQSK